MADNNESKHGEPWEVIGGNRVVIYNNARSIGYLEYPDADRAVLCVNACAGMSDEEVKGIPTIKEEYLQAFKNNVACIEDSITLKADLAEAVELMHNALSGADKDLIALQNFLTKHKGV